MSDPLDGIIWLYRGVPIESPEVNDVRAVREIVPPRPDRRGENWRQLHVLGNTETAYTSWTTNREIAVMAGEFCSDNAILSGQIVVFQVRLSSIARNRIFFGNESEDEVLIEGTIEDIAISFREPDDESEG